MPKHLRLKEAEAVCKYWEVCPTSTYISLLLRVSDSTSFIYARQLPYFYNAKKAYVHRDLWQRVLIDVETAVAKMMGRGRVVALYPADVITFYGERPAPTLAGAMSKALEDIGGQLARRTDRNAVYIFANGQVQDRGGDGRYLRLLASALRHEYWPDQRLLIMAAVEKAKALGCDVESAESSICARGKCMPPEVFLALRGCP